MLQQRRTHLKTLLNWMDMAEAIISEPEDMSTKLPKLKIKEKKKRRTKELWGCDIPLRRALRAEESSHMQVCTPALWKLSQEDLHKFKASLCFILNSRPAWASE